MKDARVAICPGGPTKRLRAVGMSKVDLSKLFTLDLVWVNLGILYCIILYCMNNVNSCNHVVDVLAIITTVALN